MYSIIMKFPKVRCIDQLLCFKLNLTFSTQHICLPFEIKGKIVMHKRYNETKWVFDPLSNFGLSVLLSTFSSSKLLSGESLSTFFVSSVKSDRSFITSISTCGGRSSLGLWWSSVLSSSSMILNKIIRSPSGWIGRKLCVNVCPSSSNKALNFWIWNRKKRKFRYCVAYNEGESALLEKFLR